MTNKSKNKAIKAGISLALVMIISLSFISAFAVGGPYLPNKELILPQNSGTTDLQYTLQNGGGATDTINVKVNILEGSEIATLSDESDVYTVAAGDMVPVNLKINIPSDAAIGQTYKVRLEFVTATSEESGQFGFGTGQEQSFNVVIGEKTVPEKTGTSALLYIILGILIILVVMVVVLIQRKNRK